MTLIIDKFLLIFREELDEFKNLRISVDEIRMLEASHTSREIVAKYRRFESP